MIKNRLFLAFSAYMILILIPLGVLFFYGFTSLRTRKVILHEKLETELNLIGEQLKRELLQEWRHFLKTEKTRPFYHYQSLNEPEMDMFYATGHAVQRSPLYQKLDHLAFLTGPTPTQTGETYHTTGLSPRLGQIIDKSLVGYFEFDPYTMEMRTPYDGNEYFSMGSAETVWVRLFNYFLTNALTPALTERLGLREGQPITPSSLLLHLRTARITKNKEDTERVVKLNELAGRPPSNNRKTSETVDVSYYDFNFFDLADGSDHYVVGFRTVLIGGEVRIQGMLFNMLSLIQEAQSYLEPLQPEFGNVVISSGREGIPLFEPFQRLSIMARTLGEERFFREVNAERRRFWATAGVLVVALLISGLHLGRLIYFESHLAQKKNDFVSAVTHELRAPLTSILMYSEMLSEGWAKGKEQKYYRYIHSESMRLSRLINNVLDFAKIERGRFPMHKEPLDLCEFVRNSLDRLQQWLEEKGLQVQYDILGSPMIEADRDALSQVIYNICDNTIKYGSTALKPILTVQIQETEDSAVLVFYDNGEGVPKEEESKVFERFYRCGNEMTRERPGTGLGLALVKEIVEKNAGQITPLSRKKGVGFGLRMVFPKLIVTREKKAVATGHAV